MARYTFGSDGILTANNPESGLICYGVWSGPNCINGYDPDSNLVKKTDARNITITYNYDQLHRVATVGSTHAKSYSNGDPVVDYYFDQTSYNGLTIAEGVSHRTGMADRTGSAAWTFDTEGRTLSEKRTVNISGLTPSAVTKTLTYAYNLDSSLKSLTYPSGHRVDYAYNTAGHALSAIDSTASPAVNYVTAASYAPHGDVAGYTNGSATGFSGIVTTNAWNNRFQPSSFNAATTGTGAHTVQSLTFNFNLGVQDNGLLIKITNGVNSGRTTNYKYDQMNRIVAGRHDATDWGTQYTIDIWGNLSHKAPCDNTAPWNCPTRTAGDSLSVTFTGLLGKKNQMDAYNYDASGNLLSDQTHAFTYDAENRPKTGGGVSYYYDGESERVAKSTGKLYLFGTNSAPVVETDTAGTMTAEYVFFNGKRVAMRKSDGSVHYYFADQIGSANVVTNATGAMPPEQDIEYHLYGEQQVYIDTLGQQYRFTGHERDTETNDDYFGARYYSSSFGRFLTPDWAATPVAIPYAVMGNPQTLNLYSYVQNNPITGIDPDGHADCVGNAKCAYDDAIASANDKKDKKDNKEQKQAQNKSSFWSRLGQRLKNGFTGHGFKTNEQLLPKGTVTTSETYWLKPNFYSATVVTGPASQSLTYVPSTNKLIYAPGPAYPFTGGGVSLTAGKANDPNGFASGPSVSGCGFFGAGGCVGASTSGDTAVQVGVGVGGWGASGGYGLDPVDTFINEGYQNLPDKTGMPTIPAGGTQWDDPDMGIPH